MGTDFRKDRTEDVTRVVKNKFEFGGGVDAERAIQWCQFPSDRGVVDGAVGIKRIIHSTEFAALAGHDIDRIMKERFGEGRCA